MKKILGIITLIFIITIGSLSIANEPTQEQLKEIENIASLTKELNIAIPKDIIVTEQDIQPIINLIEKMIQKYGYGEKEYIIIGWVCQKNNFNLNITILLKTMDVMWEGNGVYKFQSIKNSI